MENYFLTHIKNIDIENISKCPLCTSENISKLSQVYLNKKINFCETSYCNQCSFLFRSKRPSIEWFYKYWSEEKSDEKIEIKTNLPIEKQRHKRYLNTAKICEKEISGKQVLDIGTGTGLGLKAFVDRKWDCYGIEPDESRANYARNLNITMFTKSIEQIDTLTLTNKFDLVLLMQTLEHFHNPREFLQKIKTVINEERFLYVEVPDLYNYGVWSDALYWKHMQLFSKFTLNKLLNDVGLVPIKWFKPKTQPFSINHISVICKKTDRSQTEKIHKPSFEETKNAYVRNAKNELSDTDLPIKYTVNSLIEQSGIAVIPKYTDDGFFVLKKISPNEIKLRAIRNNPKSKIIKQVFRKVAQKNATDPEFETIFPYD